jgi:extracellular elastinolytic metalloproteinase
MKTRGYVAAFLCLGALAAANAHRTPHQRSAAQPFGPNVSTKYHVASDILDSSLQSFFTGPFRTTASTGPAHPFPTEAIVADFLKSNLGFSKTDYVINNAYTSDHNKVTHVYVRQIVNGLPVVNADININIDSEGRVFSFGDSFYRGRKPRPPVNDPNLSDADFPANEDDADDIQGAEDFVNMIGQMVFMDKKKGKSRFSTASRADDQSNILRLGPKDALLAFSHHINQEIVRPDGIELAFRTSFASENPRSVLTNVPYTVSGEVPTSLVYIQNQEGSLELVHDLELEMDQNWYHAHVSAVTGKIVSLVDWTSDSGYSVFPLGYNDPRDGPRIHVKDPQDENASPLGWHSQGQGKNFTVTIGNNVYAHENIAGASSWENNHRPDGGKSLIFNSTLNLDSNPKDYIDAAVTNLFYWNNIVSSRFANAL